MSEFDEYIRQGEPGRKEKAAAWQTAIGLQDVDGLKPSAYLIDTARKHIEGDISIDDVKQMLDDYYKSKTARAEVEDERAEEADKVSARIEELLTEKAFSFSPEYLARIHRHLFQGIFKFAGRYRDYDITKREWVLDGDTVLYASASMIQETLNYDFSQERKVNYAYLNTDKAIEQIARFISGIWQIHPFGEGNTRTTAVFTMKYLQSFRFEVKNDMFNRCYRKDTHMNPIKTSNAPAAIGPYSQAIDSGAGLVFVSGQLPIDPATGSFPEGGVKAQTKQSLLNASAILREAGLGLGNVVKTTVFLADMGDFAAMNEVYSEFFSAPFPARSAVAVKALPKGALVEIECIAVL